MFVLGLCNSISVCILLVDIYWSWKISMAQRRFYANDRSLAAKQQMKGRHIVSGDYNEHPSVSDKDDCLDKSSPPSMKRRHKPNTLYANDFVISSAKKEKEYMSLSSTHSSERTEATLSIPRKCGRRPKKSVDKNTPNTSYVEAVAENHENSLTLDENVNCKKLSSSPNHSQSSAHSYLRQKASTTQCRMSTLANNSLSDEQLQTDSDFAVTNAVPLTVSRRRGQPRKNLAAGKTPKTCEYDAYTEVLVYVNHLICLSF